LEDKETGKSVTQPRCLKLEPSWMSDRKSELGNLLVTDLSMAETHDAAAYKSVLKIIGFVTRNKYRKIPLKEIVEK
jgi:hypothetical protein